MVATADSREVSSAEVTAESNVSLVLLECLTNTLRILGAKLVGHIRVSGIKMLRHLNHLMFIAVDFYVSGVPLDFRLGDFTLRVYGCIADHGPVFTTLFKLVTMLSLLARWYVDCLRLINPDSPILRFTQVFVAPV